MALVTCMLMLLFVGFRKKFYVTFWQKIRIHHACEDEIWKSVPRDHRLSSLEWWHHDDKRWSCGTDYFIAEWWQTVITRDGFFYPTLTQIMDSFSCSPLTAYFKLRFQKSLHYYMMTLIWVNIDVPWRPSAWVPIQPMYRPHMKAYMGKKIRYPYPMCKKRRPALDQEYRVRLHFLRLRLSQMK